MAPYDFGFFLKLKALLKKFRFESRYAIDKVKAKLNMIPKGKTPFRRVFGSGRNLELSIWRSARGIL